MTDEHDTLDPTPNPDSEGKDFIPSKGSPARMPKQIGKYRIKKLIGTGGMGSVYQAVQEQPRRNVAIKLMKSGVTSSSALRRFEYESQLLARLRHPGIAEVYDAGTHEAHDGSVPYFVMEYIPGAKRITDYVRDKKLGTRDRLNLFLEVASAVHHGHTKGIIHRDLKPDNIIVDSHGRVKVIDFGVARATDSDMAVTTMQTDIGQLIGTVQYMSPEQVEAEPDDLDTRSDVYSLGVVLYEILCGKLPYDVSKMKIYDATRVVRDQEAMKLSTVDTTLRGDVETIVAKALEKDRDRRYQSAENLAADIQRYLNNEPINARPASLTYQVRVFARRNKSVVTGVTAVFGALLFGLAGMSYLYVDTRNARNDKDEALQVAEQDRAAAKDAQSKAETSQLEAEQASILIAKQNMDIKRDLYYAQMNKAGQVADNADSLSIVKNLTDKWIPQPGEEDLRGWEWYYLRSLLSEAVHAFPSAHRAMWTEDSIRLVFNESDGSFTVTKAFKEAGAQTYTEVEWDALPAGSLPESAIGRTSPDAKRLAVPIDDGTIQLWDLQSRRVRVSLAGHGAPIDALSWSDDGALLASISEEKGVKIWDTLTGEVKVWRDETGQDQDTHFIETTNQIEQLAWAPDGRRLGVRVFQGRSVVILDTVTGEHSRLSEDPFEDRVETFAWSHDSSRIAIAIKNKIMVLDSQTFEPIGEKLSGHTLRVNALAWGPGGKLASASLDKTIKLWDTEAGQVLTTFRGHSQTVYAMAWNPDGTQLLSTLKGGTVKIWNTTASTPSMAPPKQGVSIQQVTWSPDSQRIAWPNTDLSITIWDVVAGAEVGRLGEPQARPPDAVWSHDGTRLASRTWSTIKIWDTKTAKELIQMTDVKSGSIAWSPNDAYLVSVGGDGVIIIFDTATGKEFKQLSMDKKQWVGSVAWSPDGKLLAATSLETVWVWDFKTDANVHQLQVDTNYLQSVAFSPDSQQLVSAGQGTVLKIWDVNTGDELLSLSGHANDVRALTWSTYGRRRIASVSADRSVKIWDAITGKEALTLNGHQAAVETAAWSPDGMRLVTADEEGVIKIWDATKGYQEERRRVANESAAKSSSNQ